MNSRGICSDSLRALILTVISSSDLVLRRLLELSRRFRRRERRERARVLIEDCEEFDEVEEEDDRFLAQREMARSSAAAIAPRRPAKKELDVDVDLMESASGDRGCGGSPL